MELVLIASTFGVLVILGMLSFIFTKHVLEKKRNLEDLRKSIERGDLEVVFNED